jgi:hypothetical protein
MCVSQSKDEMSEFERENFEGAEFERDLTQALRRVDAPDGFAGHVLAAAETTRHRAKVLAMPARVRVWASGAIAAALLVGVFVQREVRAHERREQAALAQQQFETALRITGDTLDDVRRQLQQAGVTLGN